MMTFFRFVRAVLIAILLAGAPAMVMAQAQTPQQEGFVPVDQLPGQEELPAAPLVAAAYGVAWVAVLIYLFSIWRRLGTVEREIADVTRRLESGGPR
jgi:CcmD family protein